MRYDDASQAGSTASDNAPVARADVANLPQGSFGPENGNVITGAGTVSGTAGADSPGDGPTTVVDVHGAGGQTTGADGHFQALGQYGVLNMDAEGNFSYVRNAGTPDGVQDAFSYTIADKDGQTSSTTLAMNVGAAAQAAVTIPGVVNLPPGVELSDIRVSGRDLIITLPDGSHMTIPGGAVFVPQLVIGDVQVPPSNLAALLIESEPQPAANALQSSGGNFESPVPPLDPGVPLGDLIPPTELSFPQPEFRDINQFEDTEPTVVIVTPDNPAGAVNAEDQVNEAGLPPRGSEPEGSGEEAAAGDNGDPSEATTGTIVFQAQDGLQSITIDGIGDAGNQSAVTITAGSVGTVIHGQYGDLTITSVNFATGEIGYSYVLKDNTSGDNTADHFNVVVTDSDGDTATATLTVHIVDDVPTARNDTDSLGEEDNSTDGNVMTGTGTTSGAAGHDTTGADDATVTGAHPGSGSGSFTAVPQDGGGVVIHGEFGDLTLHDDGSYTYVRTSVHEGGNDVFTYQITDGDGDTSTATLTISVPEVNQPPVAEGSAIAVSEEGLPGGNPDDTGNPTDTTNEHELSGSITISDPDGDSLTVKLAVPNPDPNFTSGGETVHWALSPDGQTLTGYTGGDSSTNHVITITIDNNGDYTVNLTAPIDHPDDDGEQVASFTIPVDVSDGQAHTPTTIVVSIEDDSPVAQVDPEATLPTLTVDESPLPPGGDGDNSDTTNFAALFGGSPAYGGDGPGSVHYDLVLSADGAGSGLYALDPSQPDGKGAEITLIQNPDGSISGVVGSDVYFTISVDGTTGDVTLVRDPGAADLNLWHADSSDSDDSQVLSAAEGTIELQQTITDADGDKASASVDLSDGVFTFQDDGPHSGTSGGELPVITLDESAVGTDTSGGSSPDGTTSEHADFSVLFDSPTDFGTDGPGSVGYTLLLTPDSQGGTVGSGMFALDPGEPDGKGAEIELVQTDANTITGSVNGTDYFTITVDPATGEVTFTQINNVWHPDSSNSDDSVSLIEHGGTLEIVQTVTDADGDHTSSSADLSGAFAIQDDGPTISNVAAHSSITVDETTEGDITGWATPLTGTSADPMITATTSAGTDGLGSVAYGIALTGGVDSLASGLQTAQGDHAITLVQTNATTITGVYQDGGDQTAFTIVMNADGTVTYTQNVPLEHSDAGSSAIALNDTNSPITFDGLIDATVTVTDADGDSATQSAGIGDRISVFDDGPTAIDPDSITTTNEAQSVISATLDIPDGSVTDNFGADGPGTITFANITDGQDSGFTSGGDHITYWLSDDGQTLEGRTDSTNGTDGNLIFTVHIDQANSEYDYTQYATVDNGAGVEFNDLSGGVAGNPPFKLITEPGVQTEILASPINGSSINSDTDDMGVDSQFIDTTAGADKGVRLDFGDFTYVANGGGTADDQFKIIDNSNSVNGFKFTIDQVSNGTTADVHLKAIDADNDGQAAENTPNPAGDSPDAITSIELFDNNGVSLGVFTGNAVVGGITITFSGGEVTIDNLPAQYSIATFTNDGYNRIEITNPGNDSSSDTDGKYSISNFSIETVNTGEPIHLNYDLQITDSDGDFVSLPGAINIELDPTGVNNSATTLSTQSAVHDSAFDSSSLYANDNTGHGGRGGHDNNRDVGSNSILMGALAAAGLASDAPAAASSHDSASDQSVDDSTNSSVAGSQPVTSEGDSSSSSSSSDSQLLGDVGGKHDSAPDHSSQANNDNAKGSDNSVSNEQADAHAPADLPQGTDAPAQDSGSSPVTAAGIVMPSFEDLAGHSGGKAEGQQHNEVVGKVLADALHGGGGEGPNVESLINSLPGHGGGQGDHGNAALEALASHGAAAVPNGDTGVFAGFSGGHGMHMMEQMTMHQDAAPAHA